MLMHKNKSVNTERFAQIPRADIPRAKFQTEYTHKTTFDSGYLVPILVHEVLPGDHYQCSMTAWARLATPIFPVMDNLHLESFFFFVPNRLVWTNWVKFMGEQANPGDSIAYTIPQMVSPASGYTRNTLQDYMGLPTVGQVVGGNTVSHNALPLRCYNLIFREWFRDENLQNSPVVDTGDAASTYSDYVLLRRGKRKDYFTSALPWPQKGTAVTLPLGTEAPIYGKNMPFNDLISGNNLANVTNAAGTLKGLLGYDSGGGANIRVSGLSTASGTGQLMADLTNATAATINQIRTAFQTQKLLERDARGGTRYTEIIRSHFGTTIPDAQWRPVYLGGGHTMVTTTPIAQTSGTSASGTTTPLGNLAGATTSLAQGHGFSYAAVEHGFIIGLVCVRADLTYQQGMHRMWSRSTRYDFYFPAFAMLGEQPIYNREIYCDGSANDTAVFGYQERWAEYRYKPSMITGYFRSTDATPIDGWHYAQKFTTLPTLNTTFIQETPPLSRTLAVGTSANGQQILMDAFFNLTMVRPLPMFSVPGLIDHF